MNWQQFVSEIGYEPAHETVMDMASGQIRYLVYLRHGGQLWFADDHADDNLAA